ncbi:MAG: hypothetical protein AB1384_08875 [Actinomycetota bacterium]
MPDRERSLVRSILLDAWGDFRRRPLMFLLLALAAVPLIFLNQFCIPGMVMIDGMTRNISMALWIVGYAVCFSLIFIFWCMAVWVYDDRARGGKGGSYGDALRGVSGLGGSPVWLGMVVGLVNIFVMQFASIAVGLLLSYVASGQGSGASQELLVYINVYLGYIVTDLILVLVVMAPQMMVFEGGRKVDEVIRASYQVVKPRYRDAVLLLIVPELVVRTFFIASLYALRLVPVMVAVFVFLLTLALVEGSRLAFVAAAFNRFYYHVLEEERKKKAKSGKKSGGGSGASKQPVRRRPPKK